MRSDVLFPSAERISAIKLDGIGDFILAIPFFRELRCWCSSSKIDVIVRPELVPLVKDCPYFDKVIAVSPWNKHRESQQQFEKRGREVLDVQSHLCIIPRWDTDYYGATLLSTLTGADVRIGVSERVGPRKAVRNRGYDRYLTHPVFVPRKIVHETDRSLYLLEAFGREITSRKVSFWPAGSCEEPKFLFPTNRRIAGFGIGASVAHKQWPVEAFGELIRLITGELQFTALLLGSKCDIDRSHGIIEWLKSRGFSQVSQVIDLAGKTSLTQLRNIIECCELTVSNDSSVMHFSGALDKLTYAIGAHSPKASFLTAGVPERFAPRTDRLRYFSPALPVAPCKAHCQSTEAHCIAEVRPAQVFETILQDLDKLT